MILISNNIILWMIMFCRLKFSGFSFPSNENKHSRIEPLSHKMYTDYGETLS
jgi:hypothetical protein